MATELYRALASWFHCDYGNLLRYLAKHESEKPDNSQKGVKCMRTIIILLINAATFIIARIWWKYRGKLAATLDAHISNPENKTMTYLIAGNLNQGDTSFDFMVSELGENYTCVLFSIRGWDAKATAELIEKDIREHGYHARVFTISLSDHVARYLEAKFDETTLEVYAINPCPNREVLSPKYKLALRFLLPIAEIVCHVLGWVSYLLAVPSFGGRYSIALLIDQYWSIYHDFPPFRTKCTRGVIYSTGDDFLDNSMLKVYFLHIATEYVNTGHSDIVNSADQYHNAICNLLP